MGNTVRVVLLGTGGGPNWPVGAEREGIATALVVDGKYYLIDAGEGVGPQLRKAKLGTWQHTNDGPLDALRAVFLTHLHSDHICDLSNLFSLGPFNGTHRAELPIHLYGPGPRGVLPPLFGPGPEPEVVAPEAPTPGTVEMWNRFIQAFATDFNDRARDNRKPTPMDVVAAHDISLPAHLTADPNGNPHPDMDPVPVYEDDRVKVSCILVQHAPIFPAFAFRFDTDRGSVVFSGDTGPSENLVRLAHGVDVLVHEVISKEWVDSYLPEPRTEAQEGFYRHLLDAHTTAQQCGEIATRAEVGTLVLNHMVPSAYSSNRFAEVRRHYDGPIVIGNDLDVINVG
ncbi:MBL fold metallo-hydrolase [Kocuria arenosa]|uniref:MBL fold metallo-hydrolase n=1 Tax=Kocuria arenosa TaxID=3071446 RepID=UPI0034D4CFBC